MHKRKITSPLVPSNVYTFGSRYLSVWALKVEYLVNNFPNGFHWATPLTLTRLLIKNISKSGLEWIWHSYPICSENVLDEFGTCVVISGESDIIIVTALFQIILWVCVTQSGVINVMILRATCIWYLFLIINGSLTVIKQHVFAFKIGVAVVELRKVCVWVFQLKINGYSLKL